MRRKNRVVVRVQTPDGYRIKAWQHVVTGAVTPTNWKIAAGHLAGPVEVTKRLKNRRRRRTEERARSLAAWKASKSWMNIPAMLEKHALQAVA